MTLRQIIYDLLNIIRGAKITDDEPISEHQIASWIHEYRSKLIKQDIDKGKYPNSDYIQDYSDSNSPYLLLQRIDGPLSDLWRTYSSVPTTIDFNYKSGISYIGDVEGNQIPLVPQSRIRYIQYKKFTKNFTTAYLNNRHIYLYNPEGLKYITFRGIFNNPLDAGLTYDDEYPIPLDKVDTLKGMILKQELGIIYNSPTDDINDAQHNLLDSDVAGQRQTYRTNRPV